MTEDDSLNMVSQFICFMTTTKSIITIAVGICLSCNVKAIANEISFSYTYGDDHFEYAGTKKTETYDVAIRIADPSLTGSMLRSFTVPVSVENDNSGISGITVWVTGELTLENKVNVPDIISVPASITDGIISVEFADPIEIPSNGLYVGYSFTVTDNDGSGLNTSTSSPICLAGEPISEGLYLHTSRTYIKWKSQAENFGHSSAIKVGIEGDFNANALGIVSVSEAYATPGEKVSVNCCLINHGFDPLYDFDYTISDGVNDWGGHLNMPEPVSLSYGEKFNATLSFDAPEYTGEYGLNVEISKINGSINCDASRKIATTLWVFQELPVHKPLLEEYSGLWCGWCPSGYVVLNMMSERYHDDFVAISYHNGDVLEKLSLNEFPTPVNAFPSAYLDRIHDVPPMHSVMADNGFETETVWKSIHKSFTPAFVSGQAEELTDGSIIVKSDVSFIQDFSKSCKVAYIITANGLTDTNWYQANSYSGRDINDYIPEMKQFCNDEKRVTGLVFDDIFAAGSDLTGVPESAITDIVPGKNYSHEYIFTPESGMNISGSYDIFANAVSLDAVIILLDDSGSIINSTKVPVNGHTAIADVESDCDLVKTEYYDINGRKVSQTSSGIYIRIDTTTDGKRKVSKILGHR